MPPTASEIQLICFDLGRVLMRLCDNWNHACRVAGVPVPPEKFDPAVRGKLVEFVNASDCGHMDLAAFANAAGPLVGVEPRHIVALSNAYLLGPYPGVEELIDDIHAAGYATACLSNTNESHWAMMTDRAHANGLPLDKLTHRFASHLIGRRKPDPAIYEHLERQTGVPGPSIVFFDDLLVNVDAARQRGWQAFQVHTQLDPISQIRAQLEELRVLT